MSATYPHVRVSGGPSERGRQYGEQARERVERSVALYEAMGRNDDAEAWRTLAAETRATIEAVRLGGATKNPPSEDGSRDP